MDRFMCIECKRTFTRNSDLRRHARKFHLEKLNEIVQVKSYPYKCEHCTRNFSHRRNLKMHLKNHTERDDHPLEIAENSRVIESQSIVELLSTSEERKPLVEKKKKLIEKLQRAIKLVESEVENEKQIAAVDKLLNTIEPMIRALRQELVAAPRPRKEPANKKIEPQRKLLSTRKTTSKKSRRFEKPSQDEQNSIAVTLLQKDASN